MNKLLDVTEDLLRTQSHHYITERKIAALADVSVPLIHYYFGGKDGLLFAVIVRYTDEVLVKLKALDRIDPMAVSPTRTIFKIFIDAFYTKPWIIRIALSEFAQPESAIKRFFMRKYGPQGQTLALLRRAFIRLIDAGVYDRRINPSHAAMSMMLIILAPFMFGPMLWSNGGGLEGLMGDDWIDYVGDLFARRYPDGKKSVMPIASLPRGAAKSSLSNIKREYK